MEAPVVTGPDADGRRWLRSGECNHCGACCRGCPLRDEVLRRCADHGGETYRGFGCHTWPSDPRTVEQFPECGYSFEEVA